MSPNNPDTYIEVVLPLPMKVSTFTYRLPPDLARGVAKGMRVIVPFGSRKYYTGIVTAIDVKPPEGFEIKEVLSVLDSEPVVKHPQLKFWQWVADYYMASLGDVYRAAIPAGLKVESETFVELNPDVEPSELVLDLSERELVVLAQIGDKGRVSVAQLAKDTGFRNLLPLINSLIEEGLVIISEKLVERYRARKEHLVQLTFDITDKEAAHAAFAAVKSAPKQEDLLLTLVDMTRRRLVSEGKAELGRAAVLERSGVSSTILAALQKKGIIKMFDVEINRFAYTGAKPIDLPTLSPAQSTALAEIHAKMADHPVTLLRGVTASGKTEIYMHLIDFVLRKGDQALMLVPEIALTTQLTQRLQKVFGSRVIVYHSRFSDNERVDLWRRLLHAKEPCLVLGARSAVFLPFTRLGLAIVDEEHESSYKQFEPAPRYHARDAAIMLAYMHGAKTLLGSATPSVESYYKTEIGKWGRVDLLERYDSASLPSIEVVNMVRERKRGAAKGTFSTLMVDTAAKAINSGKQVIMFHNRRGYSPMIRCRECAWVPKCRNCDVSLTIHRHVNALVCHYCGATYPVPDKCPQCEQHAIETIGYGTERVEEEVAERFPQAKMLRMDLDSTRNKDAYERIITDFSSHKADILVGTQMVTKGLDFDGVAIVGVLNADTIINFPDFRSAERAFNMLMQVAGRAGRRGDNPGRVIVQTSNPDHPVIDFVNAHNYTGFYNHEIGERQAFLYPPFTRMIHIYLKHRDPRALDQTAAAYGQHLRGLFGNRVFGPEEPAVGRVQMLYIRKFMLKIEPAASPARVKAALWDSLDALYSLPGAKGTQIHFDVDPF